MKVLSAINTNPEQWKPVKQFDRYEVSDHGRVRLAESHRILSPKIRGGYYSIALSIRGVKHNRLIAPLILEAFACQRPNGMQAAHLNGNRYDNRLSNLSRVSPSENTRHQDIHGTRRRGSARRDAKLNDAKVREIRAFHAAGMGYKRLAKRYGISRVVIRRVASGVTWRHVDTKDLWPELRWLKESLCAP